MLKQARTIENFLSLRGSAIQNDFNGVQMALSLDSVCFLNADDNVSWLLMIKQVSNGAQDKLSVHTPGAADYSHARVHENFGGQTRGENVWKESDDCGHNSVNIERCFDDFLLDRLGGIPMRIGDVDFGSGALQLLETLHLKKIVVAWGEIADKRLPRALSWMHHFVSQTNTASVS